MENFKNIFYTILINKLNINRAELTSGKMLTDIGANSLDMVELIIELENVLGITIEDEVADNFKTVGDIERYLFKILKNNDNETIK